MFLPGWLSSKVFECFDRQLCSKTIDLNNTKISEIQMVSYTLWLLSFLLRTVKINSEKNPYSHSLCKSINILYALLAIFVKKGTLNITVEKFFTLVISVNLSVFIKVPLYYFLLRGIRTGSSFQHAVTPRPCIAFKWF